MKQRIKYLDLVKLFTIYLVIMGHVLAMMENGHIVGEKLNSIIYSFHMPLFMLLSGYFVSSKTLSKPFAVFAGTKVKQLLLPTITCTVVCLAYLFIVRDFVDVRAELIGNSWFLKTLFVYFTIFYLIKHININDWILLTISCSILFILPHASSLQVNLLFPYFWGGYMFSKYNIIERISHSRKYAIGFVLLFILLYTIQRIYNIPNYIEINIHSLLDKPCHILFRYLVAFTGCLATITSISLVHKSWQSFSFINKCAKYGQWTLGVYVLQTILVINIFPDTLAWYVETEWLFNLIIVPLLSLAFLIVCLYLIHLISKNKISDLLFFGGQYHKSK